MASRETPMIAGRTVVLADDHALVLEGLRRLLADDFEIVGTASNGRELVEVARALRPDVVVTDLAMPELDGIAATRRLKDEDVPSSVIVLTMHEEPSYALDAFAAGAVGYILKNSAGEELIRAIREVLSGRTYLSSLIARDVLSALMDGAVADPGSPEAQIERLTHRQRQVLQLVAEGRSLKAMARILGISRRTVESHKYELMRTLGVSSTAELVLTAIRLGAIPAPTASRNSADEDYPGD